MTQSVMYAKPNVHLWL